jgi:hypothetical protein
MTTELTSETDHKLPVEGHRKLTAAQDVPAQQHVKSAPGVRELDPIHREQG